jgi:hypothetical protein
MGKKGHSKDSKKKLTKKEKKQQSHLKLIQGQGGGKSSGEDWNKNQDEYKKSA